MNLRSKDGLGKKRWKTLRRRILEKSQRVCAICGGEFEPYRPHGHEVWKYLELPHVNIARLIRVEIILCFGME